MEMSRKVLTIMVVLLAFASSLYAGLELYLRPNFIVTYDTNVFSDPLPRYEADTGLLQRTGVGLFLDTDLFFREGGSTGLSLSFLYSHPVDSHAWIVEGTGTGEDDADRVNDGRWVFTQDPSIYFAIGPMFRGEVGRASLGIAVRASVGSINLFSDSVNLGVQIEPYLMVPVGHDDWLLSAGFVYDAHFYDFLLNDPAHIYRTDYFLLTIGGYVGITYRWGME